MIFFLNSSGGRIAPYSTYEDLWTENAVNETETTSLMVLAEDGELFKHENIIEIPSTGDFVIKEKVNASDGWVEVVGKRHLPGLDVWIENKAYITMTARAMLLDLLEGSGLTLIMPDDLTTKRSITGTQTPKKQFFFDIIDTFGYEFIIKGQFVYVDEELGEDKGVYATDELNLIDLQTSSDTYDFATRIEPRGQDGMTIASINGGKTYLENHSYSDKIITVYWEDNRYTNKESLRDDAWRKLEVLARPLVTYGAQIIDLARGDESSMWHFNEGDTITLLSSKTDERIKQRAISIRRYPDDPYRNAAVLANRPRSVEIDELENIYSNYEWTKTEINKLGEALELKVSTEKYEQDEETRESLFTSLQSQIQVNKDDITSRVTKTEILSDPEIRDALKGEDGKEGDVGQSIIKSTPEYYLSISDTTQAGGSWSTDMPTYQSGRYIWIRYKNEFTNPTEIKYTDPVLDKINNALNDIYDSGVVLPTSKPALVIRLSEIAEEYEVLSEEDGVGQGSSKYPAYESAALGLINYLGEIVLNMNSTSEIDVSVLEEKIEAYDKALLTLRQDLDRQAREDLRRATERLTTVEHKLKDDEIVAQVLKSEAFTTPEQLSAATGEVRDIINGFRDEYSEFKQSVDEFRFILGDKVEEDGKVVDEVRAHFTFTKDNDGNGVLSLGDNLSDVHLRQTKDRISFMKGTQELAFFANRAMNVYEVITQKITMIRYGVQNLETNPNVFEIIHFSGGS